MTVNSPTSVRHPGRLSLTVRRLDAIGDRHGGTQSEIVR